MDRGTLRPRTPLEEYVFGALRAGAAGFLFKDAPRERLLEAIRVVHGGEALLSPSITRRLIEDFAARTDPLEPPTSVLEQLTPREREVLVLVARGLSNGQIGERLVVTEAAVKSHLGSRRPARACIQNLAKSPVRPLALPIPARAADA
jgi:DNA-binding NarL/FixJ family response regulator